MAKSVVSFIRKALGMKGTSEHGGRGFYIMWGDDDPSFDEIKEKVEKLLPSWEKKGYIEESIISDDEIMVKFTKGTFDEYYRRFHRSRKVGMTKLIGFVSMTS